MSYKTIDVVFRNQNEADALCDLILTRTGHQCQPSLMDEGEIVVVFPFDAVTLNAVRSFLADRCGLEAATEAVSGAIVRGYAFVGDVFINFSQLSI